MALTKADVELWKRLKALNAIPPKPRVLEIGEANWWGDVPRAGWEASPWRAAKDFYLEVLDYESIVAVDLQGPTALQLDLNQPLSIPGTFHIVINSGTAEHVFNQHQLFQTIHDCTGCGGLMVHAAPWQGWLHHGFFTYQPEFWCSLANANGYEPVVSLTWERESGTIRDGIVEGSGDTMLYVAMQKVYEAEFQTPFQQSLGL